MLNRPAFRRGLMSTPFGGVGNLLTSRPGRAWAESGRPFGGVNFDPRTDRLARYVCRPDLFWCLFEPRMLMKRSSGMLLMFLICLLPSCGKEGGSSDGNVATHRLSLEGNFPGIAWAPNGRLVLGYVKDPAPPAESRLYEVGPDGSGLRPLQIPTPADCGFTDDSGPTNLPDGRLAFLRLCYERNNNQTPHLTMMVYDWRSGKTRPLVNGLVGENPNQFTWEPDMRRGLYSSTSSICARIRGLTRAGPDEFPITISHGSASIRVDGPLTSGPGDDCGGDIRADLPDWSPNGREVAFFASPDSLGRSGLARLEAAWNLYLVSGAGGAARAVVRDVIEPHALRWSPDGRWLAYVTAGEDGGGWLFSPTEGLHQFSSDPLVDMAWSGKGDQIVGATPLSGSEVLSQELTVFDVSEIVQPSD
jgi:hypothetical protein